MPVSKVYTNTIFAVEKGSLMVSSGNVLAGASRKYCLCQQAFKRRVRAQWSAFLQDDGECFWQATQETSHVYLEDKGCSIIDVKTRAKELLVWCYILEYCGKEKFIF